MASELIDAAKAARAKLMDAGSRLSYVRPELAHELGDEADRLDRAIADEEAATEPKPQQRTPHPVNAELLAACEKLIPSAHAVARLGGRGMNEDVSADIMFAKAAIARAKAAAGQDASDVARMAQCVVCCEGLRTEKIGEALDAIEDLLGIVKESGHHYIHRRHGINCSVCSAYLKTQNALDAVRKPGPASEVK